MSVQFVAIAAAAASAVVQVGTAFAASEIEKGKADFEKMQHELAGEHSDISALDQELARRQDLARSIASARAGMGSASVDDSGSFQALKKASERSAGKDITNYRLMGNANRLGATAGIAGADAAKQGARATAIGGVARAGSSIMGGIRDYKMLS